MGIWKASKSLGTREPSPCLPITDKQDQIKILSLLLSYEKANPTGWNRTIESMLVEWEAHNDAYILFMYYIPSETYLKRAAHVYFNNGEEGWTKWDHTFGRFLKGK